MRTSFSTLYNIFYARYFHLRFSFHRSLLPFVCLLRELSTDIASLFYFILKFYCRLFFFIALTIYHRSCLFLFYMEPLIFVCMSVLFSFFFLIGKGKILKFFFMWRFQSQWYYTKSHFMARILRQHLHVISLFLCL